MYQGKDWIRKGGKTEPLPVRLEDRARLVVRRLTIQPSPILGRKECRNAPSDIVEFADTVAQDGLGCLTGQMKRKKRSKMAPPDTATKRHLVDIELHGYPKIVVAIVESSQKRTSCRVWWVKCCRVNTAD